MCLGIGFTKFTWLNTDQTDFICLLTQYSCRSTLSLGARVTNKNKRKKKDVGLFKTNTHPDQHRFYIIK